MKDGIHPELHQIKVACACGHSFTTSSTLRNDLSVEICSNCHPHYTGKQKLVDTSGKVERFRRRYAKFQDSQAKG